MAIGIYLTTTFMPYVSVFKTVFSKIGIVVMLLVAGMVFVGFLRENTLGVETSASRAIAVTLNSAFGNHENILWLIDNKFDLNYGKTYWAGFVNPYPRAFWPDKPLGAGPILKNLTDPGAYVVGATGRSSVTTGYVTEAFMNGGFIGVIIIGVLAGVLLAFISELRLKCIGPWTVAMYCYTVFTFGASMTHNEFNGAYTRWLVDMFPMVIGYLLFERKTEIYYETDDANLYTSSV